MQFDNIDARQEAGIAATQEIESISSQSKLQRLDSSIHELSWSDVEEETTVGVGGFSRVYKVKVNLPQLNAGGRGDINSNDDDNKGSYALKCLNVRTMEKQRHFRTGAGDLAAEGEILSRLRHENIIQIHGVTAGGPESAYLGTERGYFLLLDLLQDTLSSKLNKYRNKNKKSKGYRRALRLSGVSNKASVAATAASLASERIKTVALGVAKGLEYLHSMGVVLRDLKPDNIGFDRNGTPKIFDLGFAREAHTLSEGEIAGSLRYMSPEVATRKGTYLASDVYSMGVLLWELCTLEKPYSEFTSKDEFMQNVIVENNRPSLASIQSPALRRLIRECWDADPEARPTMSRVVKCLMLETAHLDTQTTADAETTTTSSSSNTTTQAVVRLGGMALVDNSFGISGSSLSGRSGSFSRINTWTGKKMSDSSFGLLNSLSRSNLFGSKDVGGNNNSCNKPASATANAVFTQLPAGPKPQSNMFLPSMGGCPTLTQNINNDNGVVDSCHRPKSTPKPKTFLSRTSSEPSSVKSPHEIGIQKSAGGVPPTRQQNTPFFPKNLKRVLSRERSLSKSLSKGSKVGTDNSTNNIGLHQEVKTDTASTASKNSSWLLIPSSNNNINKSFPPSTGGGTTTAIESHLMKLGTQNKKINTTTTSASVLSNVSSVTSFQQTNQLRRATGVASPSSLPSSRQQNMFLSSSPKPKQGGSSMIVGGGKMTCTTNFALQKPGQKPTVFSASSDTTTTNGREDHLLVNDTCSTRRSPIFNLRENRDLLPLPLVVGSGIEYDEQQCKSSLPSLAINPTSSLNNKGNIITTTTSYNEYYEEEEEEEMEIPIEEDKPKKFGLDVLHESCPSIIELDYYKEQS